MRSFFEVEDGSRPGDWRVGFYPARGFSPAREFGHFATLTWRTLSACRDRTHAVAAGVAAEARGFSPASRGFSPAKPGYARIRDRMNEM